MVSFISDSGYFELKAKKIKKKSLFAFALCFKRALLIVKQNNETITKSLNREESEKKIKKNRFLHLRFVLNVLY